MEKKTLYDRLSHRFWLIIRDEETLAHRFSMRITGSHVLAGFAVLTMICFFIGWTAYRIVSYATSFRQESDLNRQIVQLSMSIDSLAEALEVRERYINDMKAVLNGETPHNEEANRQQSRSEVKISLEEAARIDSADSMFRRNFELENVAATRPVSSTPALLKSPVFFTPLKGVLLGKFEPERRHYGVDIVARKNEPIKAVADGTVIIASWTQDSGYTIGIQHQNHLISFYKHNSVLLRRVGDYVRAGDVIAIIGNSGELTDGPHLHFELWHNGAPVNPEHYISF